ncbi:PH domain-containing protein [Kineococcus arenarius]|uniref:PH domain-containing protein n=1 Tax=unclassified Kineococcus TaxID=2621656 RepID=UPI003D7D8790
MTTIPVATLRPPRQSVSPRAVAWWRTRSAISFAVCIGAALLLGVPVDARWPEWTAAVLAVVGVLWTLLAPPARARRHRWEVTDDAVYTADGWFWQSARVAPLSRVQSVDSLSSPLQRAFRLTGVTVTTASAMGSLKVVGLEQEEARRLVDLLVRRSSAVEVDPS